MTDTNPILTDADLARRDPEPLGLVIVAIGVLSGLAALYRFGGGAGAKTRVSTQARHKYFRHVRGLVEQCDALQRAMEDLGRMCAGAALVRIDEPLYRDENGPLGNFRLHMNEDDRAIYRLIASQLAQSVGKVNSLVLDLQEAAAHANITPDQKAIAALRDASKRLNYILTRMTHPGDAIRHVLEEIAKIRDGITNLDRLI